MSTHTVGRNEFSSDAPLLAVRALMETCDGAIVLALERLRFAEGIERPKSEKQETLGPTSLATPWNQIEATLAYERGLPLLVLVDQSVRKDGMLEPKNDWYVETISAAADDLETKEFVGRFRHFLSKVGKFREESSSSEDEKTDLEKRSIGDWLQALTPAQFWGLLTTIGSIAAGAFALGLWIGSAK